MSSRNSVFIGVRGTVLALDPSTGYEIWRTKLKGFDFVNVSAFDGKVYASTKGELFALDSGSGTVLWQNTLKGLGHGFVTIAGSAQAPAMIAGLRAEQAAAGAAAG